MTRVLGVSSVTVFSVAYPVTPADPRSAEPFGYPKAFAVADVQECFAQKAPFWLASTSFELLFRGSRDSAPAMVEPVTLHATSSPGCFRGRVPFVVPDGANPVAVRFQPAGARFDRYQWHASTFSEGTTLGHLSSSSKGRGTTPTRSQCSRASTSIRSHRATALPWEPVARCAFVLPAASKCSAVSHRPKPNDAPDLAGLLAPTARARY